MSTDDRMETITDPALIRATDDPDERGDFPCCADRAHKESLGGDSESGTYNRSNRPPAGPCTDADNPWALLPDDHPQRPKQCGGCGTKWVDAETARACERRHGDDITIPAPVGAAVALDLDALHETICDKFTGMAEVRQAADLLVSEVRRLTEESEARRVREMDAVDIATTPAPVGAAVALDLDATVGEVARLRRNLTATAQDATDAKCARDAARREADQLRHLLGSHADGHRCTCTMTDPGVYHGDNMHPPEWEQDPWCPTHPHMPYVIEEHRKALARTEAAEAEVRRLTWEVEEAQANEGVAVAEAEDAEAEVVTLRARLAEGRRIVGMLAEAVESECEDDPEMCHEHDRTDDGRCPLLVDLNRAHAALATGEGK